MENITIKFIKDMLMSSLNMETSHLIYPYDGLEKLDHGLTKILWSDFDYHNPQFHKALSCLEEGTVYLAKSTLAYNHIFLKLPDTNPSEFFVIGPFLLEEVTLPFYERIIGQNKISSSAVHFIKTYFCTIPVVDEITIISTAKTIASNIFPNYDPDNFKTFNFQTTAKISDEPSTVLNFSMKVLEERYKHENAFMAAISQGNTNLAFQSLEQFSQSRIPPRVDNPQRNQKNTLFVLNTLCRKAAEQGNVHPVYLDQLSTKIAIQIERATSMRQLHNIPMDMTRKYCMLVKNYSLSKYSHIVRKTINYVKLNLASPLSLQVLAGSFKVNATYLSSQFKKETGQTLTDFIHKERIHTAIQLLNTTDLPIQEISYHVGIDDLSYFSKLFKKQVNMSPLQYRTMMRSDL